MVLLRVGAAVARWETGLVLIDAGGDLSASAAGVGASVMIGKVEAHWGQNDKMTAGEVQSPLGQDIAGDTDVNKLSQAEVGQSHAWARIKYPKHKFG